MRIQGNNLDFKLKGNISSSLRNNSNRQNGNLERKNTINFGMIWLYSLISIIKNDFKKENQKLIWIILIIFLPFTAYLYPDFRKVQVINRVY